MEIQLVAIYRYSANAQFAQFMTLSIAFYSRYHGYLPCVILYCKYDANMVLR